MDRDKGFFRIAFGVGCFAVAVLAVLLVCSVSELNGLRKGIEEGFELKGAYVKPVQDGSVVSFYEDRQSGDLLWKAQDRLGGSEGGRVDGTVDPNVYVLSDADGVSVGWVHLSYSNREAEGDLYLQYDEGDVVKLERLSRTPILDGASL